VWSYKPTHPYAFTSCAREIAEYLLQKTFAASVSEPMIFEQKTIGPDVTKVTSVVILEVIVE